MLFKENKPRLIEDCNRGKVNARYLVEYPAGIPTVTVAQESDDGQKAIEELAELEARLGEGEKGVRQDFTK